MKRREGFTLTELLVGIPVFVLLGTLLFASLDDAKQKLQASQCLNNMRQWGLAFEMYANEYNDYLPWTGSSTPISSGFSLNAWFNILPHYMNQPGLSKLYSSSLLNVPLPGTRSLYICPSAPAISNMSVTAANPYFSYAMNRVMTGLSGRVYKRSIAAFPGQVILLSESENNQYPFTDGFYIGVFSSEANQIPPGNAPRHFAGRNFVFVDGHAAWYGTNDYSRTKAESTNANIEWAKPRVLYWFPCGNPDLCNKT